MASEGAAGNGSHYFLFLRSRFKAAKTLIFNILIIFHLFHPSSRDHRVVSCNPIGSRVRENCQMEFGVSKGGSSYVLDPGPYSFAHLHLYASLERKNAVLTILPFSRVRIGAQPSPHAPW